MRPKISCGRRFYDHRSPTFPLFDIPQMQRQHMIILILFVLNLVWVFLDSKFLAVFGWGFTKDFQRLHSEVVIQRNIVFKS
jgi:hypothetical protein